MKITKAALSDGKIILTTNWVTNGHWCAKKKVFENKEVLKDMASLLTFNYGGVYTSKDDDLIKEILPVPNDVIKYKRTNKTYDDFWFMDHYGIVRVFVSEDGEAYIREKYVKRLKLKELYSIGSRGVFYNDKEDPSIMIMPCWKSQLGRCEV